MIWLVLLGVVGVSGAIYFVVKFRRKTEAAENSASRFFYKHVVEVNLNNPDGTNRQEVIRVCHQGEDVLLVPEPGHLLDSHALKVCRVNGQQLGFLAPDGGRMARDMARGWTFRTTVDEIYPFEENRQQHGVRVRVEVQSKPSPNELNQPATPG